MDGATLVSVLGTAVFAAVIVGTSILASSGLGLERRALLIERRDPNTAEALRRAMTVTDLARSGVFGDEAFSAVCTPSRRAWFDVARSGSSDLDPRVHVPEESLPPMPATVVALASGAHVARGRGGAAHPSRVGQPADRTQPTG